MTKICKKCHKEYSDSHKFCNDCGKKLVKKEEHTLSGHHSKGTKKIIILTILGALLLISAIVIFVIPFPYTATEEYTEKEPYVDKEYYTEKEPHQDTEYYQDTVQYTDKECTEQALTQNVKGGQTQFNCVDTNCVSFGQTCVKKNWLGNCLEYQSYCQSSTCSKYKASCNLIVKNLDSAGGVFSFDAYYKTGDGIEHFVESKSKYLQPSDEESFIWYYTFNAGNIGNCNQKNFVTPKKTECENVIKSTTVQKSRPITRYKDVEKSRDTTKYKDVQKTRSVTKYATLFQQWTGQVQLYYKV